MPDQVPLNQPQSKTDLFVSFTVLALQGFGGVLAVVQRELVEKKRWMTREQFIEDWAVAQILPGPNVINLSLMIGGRYFGLAGALAGVAGMLTAPLVVALLLAAAFGGVAFAQGRNTVSDSEYAKILADFKARIAAAGTGVQRIKATVVSAIDLDTEADNKDLDHGADQLNGRRQAAIVALADKLSKDTGIDVQLFAGQQVKLGLRVVCEFGVQHILNFQIARFLLRVAHRLEPGFIDEQKPTSHPRNLNQVGGVIN